MDPGGIIHPSVGSSCVSNANGNGLNVVASSYPVASTLGLAGTNVVACSGAISTNIGGAGTAGGCSSAVGTSSRYRSVKMADRLAFLFTRWLLLFKKQRRVLPLVSTSASAIGLKLKKKIPLERFHLIDRGIEYTKSGAPIEEN
ncbi:unnamed protein product [Protopolystoma xenopodis]|uniref:Uncharacterized protein n=1 Tax=Protopolystoma xenopodis TaxID=117903 RepID=A0A448WEY7_9PLAT|nr:unnamed protein product [Protopolystoma xenopodis]